MRVLACCLFHSAVACAGEPAELPFYAKDRPDLLKKIIVLNTMDRHRGADPLLLYSMSKEHGFSDEEIRQALLDRIRQLEVSAGRRNSHVTAQCAVCGLDLFRGDPLLEAAVLAATDTNLYEGMFPNPGEFLKRDIATYGSDEMLAEYRDLLVKKFGAEKLNMVFFDKVVASRPRHNRDGVATVSPPEAGLASDPPARFKPDAWRPKPVGVPAQMGAPGTSAVPSPDRLVWLIALGGSGLVALGIGLFVKRRALPSEKPAAVIDPPPHPPCSGGL